MSMALTFAVFLLAVTADATRIRTDADQAISSSLATRVAAFTGKVLQKRYRLQELLYSGQHGASKRATPTGPPAKDRKMDKFPWGTEKDSPLSHEKFSSPQHLSQGSFGDTWKAFDEKDKAEVAIKIFYTGDTYYTSSNEFMTAAVQEGEEECKRAQEMVAGESSYPEGRSHICRCLESHVYDQVNADDVPFLVLELCGTTLDEAVNQKDPDSEDFLPFVRHAIMDTLKGIRFMSGLKPPMVHNDIHLENILVSSNNEAKIIDFGLSHHPDEDERDDAPWGTGLSASLGMQLHSPRRCFPVGQDVRRDSLRVACFPDESTKMHGWRKGPWRARGLECGRTCPRRRVS